LVTVGIATYGAGKFGNLMSLAELLNSPYQSSEVPKVQLNRAPHPIPIDKKWKDDWNSATFNIANMFADCSNAGFDGTASVPSPGGPQRIVNNNS